MNAGFVCATEMLPVPRAHSLTRIQADGKACVWCQGLPDDRIDLGPRISPAGGALKRWQPRACRPCTGSEAARVYQLHIRTCARCGRRNSCPDARALYALAREHGQFGTGEEVTGDGSESHA